MTTKLLCELTGTRYYTHNEEIDFAASKVVNVFDENDVNIGHMPFGEVYQLAMNLQKDVVLRNAKTSPPVVKVMNYKLELIKRVFKKIGSDMAQSDQSRTKTVLLSPTISLHDLESKKRRTIEFLKKSKTCKFFMKVNVYDQDNISKGKLILYNIAEDLKSYAKIVTKPGEPSKAEKLSISNAKKTADEEEQKGPNEGLITLADQVHFVQLNTGLIAQQDLDDDGFEDYDDDESKQYLMMELESTANFKDFDVDKMLEQTNIDDFLKQIYSSGATKKAGELSAMRKEGKLKQSNSLDLVNELIKSGDAVDQDQSLFEDGPMLKFDDAEKDQKETREEVTEKTLRQVALDNLR